MAPHKGKAISVYTFNPWVGPYVFPVTIRMREWLVLRPIMYYCGEVDVDCIFKHSYTNFVVGYITLKVRNNGKGGGFQTGWGFRSEDRVTETAST